jgi:TFIIF-interacting CTD phosphatase-like protein
MSGNIFRIVFDLDETLVYCAPGTNIEQTQASKVDMFRLKDGTTMMLRPGYYALANFINAHFDEIYVFTAATEDYAKDVIDVIFKGLNFVKMWTQKDCVICGDNVYKILHDKKSPGGSTIDSVYTIMVDDRPEVSTQNIYTRNDAKHDNHIIVPRFTGSPHDVSLLDVVEKLRLWKSRCINCA